MANFIEKITDLALTAEDLRYLNPAWKASMIEDYLAINDNFKTIAEEIDLINETNAELIRRNQNLAIIKCKK